MKGEWEEGRGWDEGVRRDNGRGKGNGGERKGKEGLGMIFFDPMKVKFLSFVTIKPITILFKVGSWDGWDVGKVGCLVW